MAIKGLSSVISPIAQMFDVVMDEMIELRCVALTSLHVSPALVIIFITNCVQCLSCCPAHEIVLRQHAIVAMAHQCEYLLIPVVGLFGVFGQPFYRCVKNGTDFFLWFAKARRPSMAVPPVFGMCRNTGRGSFVWVPISSKLRDIILVRSLIMK